MNGEAVPHGGNEFHLTIVRYLVKTPDRKDGSAPSSDSEMQSRLKRQADRERDASITAIPQRLA
jgi:hypothetical protein